MTLTVEPYPVESGKVAKIMATGLKPNQFYDVVMVDKDGAMMFATKANSEGIVSQEMKVFLPGAAWIQKKNDDGHWERIGTPIPVRVS